jgi:hypothetical protein
MDFFKKFEFTPTNMLKSAGLLVIAVVVLAVIVRLLGSIVGFGGFMNGGVVMPNVYVSKGGTVGESAAYDSGAKIPALSIRNVSSTIVPSGTSVGGGAEDFEATEYTATIETRNKTNTCAEVMKLKKLDYVIFDSATEYDKGCEYLFKVENNKVAEVLTVVKSLDPKELSENTYTIKKQLDDFTSETDILKNRLDTISTTLKDAVDAYDKITALATHTQDADSLAKIISSKLEIVERLTQERINITAELERLERAKAEQLDKLKYATFRVNVYENRYVDTDSLKDSWKSAIKKFINEVSLIAQGVTVNLLSFILSILQVILYVLIMVVAARYVWHVVKYIWKK